MRYALLISLLLIFGASAGIFWLHIVDTQESEVTPSTSEIEISTGDLLAELVSTPTDFGALGTIVDTEGGPALLLRGERLPLVMDTESVCAESAGGEACPKTSSSFLEQYKDRPVTLEGVLTGNTILVRVVRLVEDISLATAPETGREYIGWATAQKLLESCRVQRVTQNAQAELVLLLEDRREMWTIQPQMDAILPQLVALRSSCSRLSFATE